MRNKIYIFMAIPLILLSSNSIVAQESGTALLLIDIQDFYFPGGFSELVNPVQAAENAAKLLDYFRENNKKVIHVIHKTSKQNGIYALLAPTGDEKVIEKSEVSCFNNTELLDYLKEKNIDTLVIAGMQTHMCVEGAVRAAYDNGFKVILVEDACATKDLNYNDKTIPAEMVHLSTLSTLKTYAGILTTEEFLKTYAIH